MDTFTTVLSVFSTVCAIVFGYIAFVRNRDKDKESNVKHDATVLTEIGYIKANTDEIKAEQKEQRKTNTEFVTRLTDVEASAKSSSRLRDRQVQTTGSATTGGSGFTSMKPIVRGAVLRRRTITAQSRSRLQATRSTHTP